MPNDMEHERHRWSYMSEAKLATRLGRIRDPNKLENFITLASENRNVRLLRLAAHRAHQLGHSNCERYAEESITVAMRAAERGVLEGPLDRLRDEYEDPSRRSEESLSLHHWAVDFHASHRRRDQVVRRVQRSIDMSKVNSCFDCGARVPEMNQRTYEYDEVSGLHHFHCPECELRRRVAERRSNTKPPIRKIRFRRKNDKTK